MSPFDRFTIKEAAQLLESDAAVLRERHVSELEWDHNDWEAKAVHDNKVRIAAILRGIAQ